MIVIKKLWWSNAFSYGPDNEIDFSKVPLLQLVGRNGHGKTSIILVLEEVLFNKNSKGIPRGKVLNRYITSNSYSIGLIFEKDNDEYCVETKRSSTQSVKLVKNGVDISGHTSTSTYKLIEQILGMDHKTFTQIVNQLSSSSLEFLSATDGNRKKFLIDLLSLERYSKGGEVFKASAKVVDAEITALSAKISSIESLIARNKAADLSIKQEQPVPVSSFNAEELQELEFKLRNITADNKAIIQNNKYKDILDSIVLVTLGNKPVDDSLALSNTRAQLTKTVQDCTSFITKMNSLGTKCPTCLSDIDSHKVSSLVDAQTAVKQEANKTLADVDKKASSLKKELADWMRNHAAHKEYEEYHALYNPSLPKEIASAEDLSAKIAELKALKTKEDKAIKDATDANVKVAIHNSKVSVLLEQIQELQTELPPLRKSLQIAQEKLTDLQVLIKTFSNSGLVAYKIECLVKDLETLTNEYLNELSGGRFQLSFEIAGSDKLNVVINDNGNDIEISALSGGEKARVNVATLLGIRKLLQSLSNNRINLLFLDETIDSLDDDGKEKLVEVLLNEEYLNTVIVSHGFQHPLIEKLLIIKTNNISRIENG
jgi:DNA repair exonuclease SbcCD ATPase subunit